MQHCRYLGRLFAPALAAGVLFVSGALTLRAEDRLIRLDGSYADAVVRAIEPGGAVRVEGDKVQGAELQGLRRIERDPAAGAVPAASPAIVAYLAGGGRLLAQQVTIKDQVCSIDWAYGNGLAIPMDLVRGILIDAPGAASVAEAAATGGPGKLRDEFLKALQSAEPAKNDTLFARRDSRLQPIPGLLQDLSAEKAVFVWEGKARPVERLKVYGIVMAAVGSGPDLSGQCRLSTRDGSTLWARVTGLTSGQLSLEIPPARAGAPAVKLTVPWDQVLRMDVRSDRVAFAADLDPTQVVEEVLVTLPRPYRRNHSVDGGPIVLGDQTYESGLGVHARALLTYDVAGRYDTFAATIGIDANTLPKDKGDCEFVVLGDGKELFRARARRADKPQPIQVKISGVRKVTLAVEPGADLDIADHADWADARFIRETR